MARMIELVRKSQLPSYLMSSAVRGALRCPPDEMIEILVYLALHNRVFGEQARMTLAGWDENSSRAAAGDPRTHQEVLDYFISPKNLRPALLPTLLENPSVRAEPLMELAESGSRQIVEAMLASPRVKSSPALLKALRENPALRANEIAEIEKRLTPLGIAPLATPTPEPQASTTAAPTQPPVGIPETVSETGEAPAVVDALTDDGPADELIFVQAIEHYLKENEHELSSEADKPFQAVTIPQEGTSGPEVHAEAVGEVEAHPEAASATAVPEVAAKDGPARPAPAAHKAKKPVAHPKEERRDTTLMKISKLDIKGRIALAMRGNKEERSLLIRDATKLVALAVLESPKVSDGEVENFAQQKNVLEAVLRAIPMKRKYAKNYAIMRNLVYNPRTPLDQSLGLMKNLLIHDLKNLSGNKEVSDTIRKLALRMFKQKSEKKQG
jgi:hypothetical protein